MHMEQARLGCESSLSTVLSQFRSCDKNGDGTIDREELKQVLHALNADIWTTERVAELFAAIDVNNDDKIQVREFLAWAFDSNKTDLAIPAQCPFSVERTAAVFQSVTHADGIACKTTSPNRPWWQRWLGLSVRAASDDPDETGPYKGYTLILSPGLEASSGNFQLAYEDAHQCEDEVGHRIWLFEKWGTWTRSDKSYVLTCCGTRQQHHLYTGEPTGSCKIGTPILGDEPHGCTTWEWDGEAMCCGGASLGQWPAALAAPGPGESRGDWPSEPIDCTPGRLPLLPPLNVGPVDFTLMTFNVEEYWHGFQGHTLSSLGQKLRAKRASADDVRDWIAKLEAHILRRAALVRAIIEEHLPDVLCLQEHSLGFTPAMLKFWGVLQHLEPEHQTLDGKQLLAAVLPDGYDFHCMGTTEVAKYSELANAVAWKTTKLEPTSERARVGHMITPKGKKNPSGESCYTPRSAALVELRPIGGGVPFVACSTHLMGGRFEDSLWASDKESGANERVSQVLTIDSLLRSDKFECHGRGVIAGDFNVMKMGFTQGPFVEGSQRYVFGGTMLYTKRQLERDYREVYVPYQIAVHTKLEELGYVAAYGQSDDTAAMKTSAYGGCPDWIYARGLDSKRDERVIPAGIDSKDGASDHNAVLITLTLT